MIYKLTNVSLEKVPAGKQNEGKVYVRAEVINPKNRFAESTTQAFFSPAFVKEVQKYFAVANNGTGTANTPLPDDVLTFTGGRYEEFAFPEMMVQIDTDGTPRRNPKNGNMYMRDRITVLCQYEIDDETGERGYAKGWDPVSRGTSIMSNLYAPLSRFNAVQTVAPPQLINGQTAPNVAPPTTETPGAVPPPAA